MWSAVEGEPLKIAGLIPFPIWRFRYAHARGAMVDTRLGRGHPRLLIILLVAMVPIHVGAALKHHFWDRHDVLRGMLPDLEGGDGERPAV